MASLHSSLQTPGCSKDNPAALRPGAGAAKNQSTDGSSDNSSTSEPLAEVVINHNQTTTTIEPQTFARYLILSHQDRTKDITKYNPYAIEKAMSVLIGGHFVCTRYDRTKLIEVYVRSKRQSDSLLAATELDCTEYKIPITVTKHRTKNTSKGVVYCDFFANTPKAKLLADMAADKVIDVYRFTETKDGVEVPKDSYCLTFDSEIPPKEMKMGYIKIKVTPYYPNPRLCRNCQRYGHGANLCHNKQICAKCGEEGHSYNGCENNTKCIYCEKDHPASTKTCPMWILEKRIIKLSTDERCRYPDARKKVYRDSQDLVAKIPSLASHVSQSWSGVVSTGRSNQPAPPLQPAQPPFDPASHPFFVSLAEQQKEILQQQKVLSDPSSLPAFVALKEQQKSLAEQQKLLSEQFKALQEQQKQNGEIMQTVAESVKFLSSMFGLFVQHVAPPSSHHHFKTMLVLNPADSIPSPSSPAPPEQHVSMDTQSSGNTKRPLSDSSVDEDNVFDHSKKTAVQSDESSNGQEKAVASPALKDNSIAHVGQPQTNKSHPAPPPPPPPSGPSKASSKVPVKEKQGLKKPEGRGLPENKDKPLVSQKPRITLNRGGPSGNTVRKDLK